MFHNAYRCQKSTSRLSRTGLFRTSSGRHYLVVNDRGSRPSSAGAPGSSSAGPAAWRSARRSVASRDPSASSPTSVDAKPQDSSGKEKRTRISKLKSKFVQIRLLIGQVLQINLRLAKGKRWKFNEYRDAVLGRRMPAIKMKGNDCWGVY